MIADDGMVFTNRPVSLKPKGASSAEIILTNADYSITRLRSIAKRFEQNLAELEEYSEGFPYHYVKKGDAMEKPELLRNLATNAKTIIDIGINHGTPALYRAFADRPFVLIDPAKNAEEKARHKPREYVFVNKAVGEKKDTLTLHENSGKTSLLKPTGEFKTWDILDEYEVEVDRLDTIIKDLGVEGPFGVKMDIQGFELPAIRGMTGIMDQVDFLVCEVQVRRTSEGVYQFSDLIVEMHKHDFVFYNFMNQWKPTARFYDVVFLRRSNSKFDQIDDR
ncbi:FkbM family methyltransferase [Rhizobium sp. XQZ8]|uniref:FkbM family methyltransferase n=1 Tax=Rhizobium populisoli TaxID=2859785 RepID=UPI001CA5A78F|nr:FkbM family methyltransferase [Rhizobium populisoli]MBW6425827.1 FkbM family methyltransferase [Rhizobium populisoli]